MARFSRRPQDVATARQFLIDSRGRPDEQLPTYGELAVVIGGIPRGVAPVLNSVARECDQRTEPDLTVLVVDAKSGLPRSFGRTPVVLADDSEQRWVRELARVRKFHWPDVQEDSL
jgi:hypothetical protein